MDATTSATGLTGVLLRNGNDFAPWILANLVLKPGSKAIVAPRTHGSHRLAPQSSQASTDHLLCLENGDQDHTVVLHEPLDQLAV